MIDKDFTSLVSGNLIVLCHGIYLVHEQRRASSNLQLIIMGSALNYQGYAQPVAALKKNEDSSFTNGFKKFYGAYWIFLISTIVLILDTVYRI